MPSVSPVSVPGSSSSGQQEAESPLPNPGGFEECHRKCKGILNDLALDFHDYKFECFTLMSVCPSEVFPMQMEGVRLTVNKGLSNHFQVGPVCSLVDFPEPCC